MHSTVWNHAGSRSQPSHAVVPMGAAKDNGKYDRLRKPLRKSLDVIDLSDI